MTTSTSTTTKLSTAKVALLLQCLLDVKNDSQKYLSKDIEKLVDNLVDTQEAFIAGIDNFMHRDDSQWDVDDEETVKAIINTCPEFLHTKNRDGFLPLHCVAGRDHKVNILYVPLLAKVGREHGVGGEDSRGGLVVKSYDGMNALQYCAFWSHSSHEVIKALMETHPPLFEKEDISKYELLHLNFSFFGNNSSLEVLKFYINMDPSCVLKKDTCGYLPIKNAISTCSGITVVKYLLKRALEYNPQHHSIGGLFSNVRKGRGSDKCTVLETLTKKFRQETTWDMIENEVSRYKDIPILHQVIEHVPEQINQAINRFPHSLFLRDKTNRLPIHVALEKGLKWSNNLVAIMSANMSYLNQKDPVTGYYPFALATEEPRCDLRTIYYLLRIHPGLIESGIGNDKHAVRESKLRKIE